MENDLKVQCNIDENRVTKAEVFKFLDSQFCLADQDNDGALHLKEYPVRYRMLARATAQTLSDHRPHLGTLYRQFSTLGTETVRVRQL
jgi:hypothetical protein